MMGFPQTASITPTLTLPRQGGGNSFKTQVNPPSPGGRGLGGGGSRPLNLGFSFLLLTFYLFDNFRNEERKDKQPYGKENLARQQITQVS